jgi:spoIIIJ-associated protein
MEWVETTGRTIDAALDAALDELGVDEADVEFEVLQEPKSGVLGLGRADARIRARVKPISREKPGERQRRRGGRKEAGSRSRSGRAGSGNGGGNGGGNGRGNGGGNGRPESRPAAKATADTAAVATADAVDGEPVDGTPDGNGPAGTGTSAGTGTGARRRRRRGGRGRGGSGGSRPTAARPGEDEELTGEGAEAGALGTQQGRVSGGERAAARPRQQDPVRNQQESEAVSTEEDVPIEEQAAAAKEFTRGLVEAFDLGGTVRTVIEDDVVTVHVEGDNLGLLVGPKGATLHAIEELVRTVVQRQTDGHGVRIHVDVAGYRAKRRAALEAFTRQLVEKVLETGKAQALEPMSSADRKIVHDTAGSIEGVVTESDGEDPRRRVVIRRA